MTSAQQPLVPAAAAQRERVIRKSRFIGHAERVTTRAEAMALLARRQQQHPDARHHCWAYLLGDPEATASAAMNDDGEPSGTAGKPILNVIQHKGIGDVMVVVTRYFGGIKLGAGGLVRAYAGTTEAVLAALPLTRHQPQSRHALTADFADEQAVRHWCEQHGADIVSVRYGERVTLVLDVPDHLYPALQELCQMRGIDMA